MSRKKNVKGGGGGGKKEDGDGDLKRSITYALLPATFSYVIRGPALIELPDMTTHLTGEGHGVSLTISAEQTYEVGPLPYDVLIDREHVPGRQAFENWYNIWVRHDPKGKVDPPGGMFGL